MWRQEFISLLGAAVGPAVAGDESRPPAGWLRRERLARPVHAVGWLASVVILAVLSGATAAGTAGNIDAAMLRNLFGLDVQIVNGYAGSAAKRLAFERGEIDGDCGGVTSLPPDWLPAGKIAVIMRLSPELSPGLDPT